MSTNTDRRVPLTSVANFRDLGGLPLAGGASAAGAISGDETIASLGTIARGKVYRSASLARLSDADRQSLAARRIRTVYDLRTDAERAADPDLVPLGARLIPLDVLADGDAGVASAIARLRTDPGAVNELLGGGQVQVLLEASYRDFIELPSALRSYRALYQGIADGPKDGSALFHCTAGKDRTGWAAAALLCLLGVDDATMRADYLQTNDDLLPTLEPLFTSAAARGVDAELLREAYSVREQYLDAALNALDDRYGTVERYFTEGLGLTGETIDTLRARLTV